MDRHTLALAIALAATLLLVALAAWLALSLT